MPQASYEYAVGRISELSTKMLDSAQLRRIHEAPDEKSALAMLLETGYGGGLSQDQVSDSDIDYVIRSQLQLSRKTIWELTPAPELTSLFFLRVDTHNIKTLLKARLLGREVPDILIDDGVIPLPLLKECINTKNYDPLPEAYRKALNKIEAELQHDIDPLKFSAQIDSAMFTHIKNVLDQQKDHSFVRKFFSMLADFQNARSVIRARLLGWDVDKLKNLLLDGGEIDHSVFVEAFDLPKEQLAVKFNRGSNGKLISAAVEEYVATGNTPILKKKMEAASMNILRSVKWDMFSLGPIIGYLIGREAEAKALRVIFGAKRGGFELELPELYA